MFFTKEYVNKCFQAFQYSPFINQLVKNLEENNSPNVRSYMDVSIDDLQEQINQPIGQGEEEIHNARVHQLKSMYTCWYELFRLLEEDDEGERRLLPSTSTEQ